MTSDAIWNWHRNRFVLLLLCLFFLAHIAVALPILSTDSVTVDPGVNSFFDVFVEVPAGDASVTIKGFTIDLSIPAGDVSFTSAVTTDGILPDAIFPQTVPGFAGVGSFHSNLGTLFELAGTTPTNIAFNDTRYDFFDALAAITLNPGDKKSLGRVNFSVGAGASGGVVPISFLLPPPPANRTGLSDPFLNLIPFDIAGGSITINAPPGVVIPEPSTLLLFAIGVLGILGLGWRRRS